MKKVFLICFVAVISCLTSVAFVYAGWPINRTLPIEGTVTDATTGEPIENVIISAEWAKWAIRANDIFSKKLIVTGKDGRYRIPSRLSFHIISRFSYVEISVRHPLYESKVGWGNSYVWHAKGMEHLRKGGKEWYYERPEIKHPSEKRGVHGYYKDGKIHFDIKLVSLEEKYRDNVGVWGKKKSLSTEFRYNGPAYFSLAKRKKITIDYIEILRNWENITNRFPNDKHLKNAFKKGKEQIIEIMEKER